MARLITNGFLALILAVLIAGIGFTFWMRDRYVVPILMYHHIGVPSGTKWRLNCVSQKSFDYQLNFIKRHGFQVITIKDMVEGIKQGHQFSRNRVVITFDDGYEDNYTYGFPLLKKYGFPATIFLISDKIGAPGFLTWKEIEDMEKNNITFGAHTRHHVYLPRTSLTEAQSEIAGSKSVIESHLGHRIDFFAYPSGGFTPEVKRIVRESGYQAAVSTNRGKDRLNMDLYELKRIHINNTDDCYSGLIMWFKLSGYYNLFRHLKDGGSLRHARIPYEDNVLFK